MKIIDGVIPLILGSIALGTVGGLIVLAGFHMKLLANDTRSLDYWFYTKAATRSGMKFDFKKAFHNLVNTYTKKHKMSKKSMEMEVYWIRYFGQKHRRNLNM